MRGKQLPVSYPAENLFSETKISEFLLVITYQTASTQNELIKIQHDHKARQRTNVSPKIQKKSKILTSLTQG